MKVRPPEPEFSVKERKGRTMEGALFGRSPKQSSVESYSKNHSASLLFHAHQSFSFT